jgi:hypothetical protein
MIALLVFSQGGALMLVSNGTRSEFQLIGCDLLGNTASVSCADSPPNYLFEMLVVAQSGGGALAIDNNSYALARGSSFDSNSAKVRKMYIDTAESSRLHSHAYGFR